MSLVLWLLALICLVVGMALVLPLRLELEVRKQAEWRVIAAIRPFGRYGPRIPIQKGRTSTSDETPPKNKRRGPRRGRPGNLVPAMLRFMTDILERIRVGKLSVDARFGLGDPALTGQAYGLLCPVIHSGPAMANMNLRVVPVFDRTVLTGAADIVLCVVPITLLGPTLRLGWRILGSAR